MLFRDIYIYIYIYIYILIFIYYGNRKTNKNCTLWAEFRVP